MSGTRTSSVVFACMDADTLGGIQRVTHTVAQGLADRGHDVHVIGLHRAETRSATWSGPATPVTSSTDTPIGKVSSGARAASAGCSKGCSTRWDPASRCSPRPAW